MLKNDLPDYQQEIANRFEVEALPYFPLLKRFAFHLTRNRAEAEDLLQDTFTPICEKTCNLFKRGKSLAKLTEGSYSIKPSLNPLFTLPVGKPASNCTEL